MRFLPPSDALTAEARSSALADLLRQATQASLDPDAVLEVATRWCARVLGDGAIVWMLDGDDPDTLRPGPLAHRDPVREDALASAPPDPAPALRRRVLEREVAVLDGPAIVAPLRSRGRVLGLLAVFRDDADRSYRAEDLELVAEVAARVGLVLDNARLYERVRVQAATLENVDAAVCAIDADGRITSFNPAAERMFDRREADVLGRSPLDLLSAEPPERVVEARAAVLAHGRHSASWLLKRPDGEVFEGHIHTVIVRDDDGTPAGMVAHYQDLSERLRLIAQLERRAAQQAAVAELGERALEAEHPSALIDRAVDMVRSVLAVEQAALFELVDDERSLALRAGAGFAEGAVGAAHVPAGWSEHQEGFTLVRREPVIVDDARAERRFLQAPLLADHLALSGVTVAVQGRGGGVHAVLAAYAARPGAFTPDDVTFLQSLANVLGDALDRFAADEENVRRGSHDPLTQLPNRALVMERLDQAAAREAQDGERIALLFCDLDHFKNVNDSLGHRAGDTVLRQVADRLRTAVRPGDTVGRFGGDEFVIVCERVAGETMARTIADRLLSAFTHPFRVEGDDHVLGISVGIALMDPGDDSETVLRDADAAMYRAKQSGRGQVELFDTGMRARAVDRLTIEAGLRRALDAGGLEVHYQPIVDLADGAVVAAEALVRWRHPERGLLAPGAFVGVAEDSGLIVALGRFVLEHACAHAALWDGLPVHVNLSPRQLADRELPEVVARALADAGVAPSALALEITESMLIERGPARLELLERLHAAGVTLLLDDFGTGWSSLGRLAELPIGGLKVDRSFVADVEGRGGAIVDAILRLARAFSLPVVAEGVETQEQLDALRALGCERAQGFLFARAVPADAFAELLLSRPRAADGDRA